MFREFVFLGQVAQFNKLFAKIFKNVLFKVRNLVNVFVRKVNVELRIDFLNDLCWFNTVCQSALLLLIFPDQMLLELMLFGVVDKIP